MEALQVHIFWAGGTALLLEMKVSKLRSARRVLNEGSLKGGLYETINFIGAVHSHFCKYIICVYVL